MVRNSWRVFILLPFALVPAGCSGAPGEEADPPAPFELRPGEIQLARQLAEAHLPADAGDGSAGKVVFVKVELLPEAQAQSAERRALVIHYRYRSDETIHTFIDLKRVDVFHRDVHRHFPTPLAEEEIARAAELARANPQLARLFEAEKGLQLEYVPTRVTGHGDPLFGHRLVNVLLRSGANYLIAPRVVVDLTEETVLVE
jgi:hypothetical protein